MGADSQSEHTLIGSECEREGHSDCDETPRTVCSPRYGGSRCACCAHALSLDRHNSSPVRFTPTPSTEHRASTRNATHT
eukprot:1927461-Prymnesium_polylepis.1